MYVHVCHRFLYVPQFIVIAKRDLTFRECIGEGAIGTVYSGKWKRKDVAIKTSTRLQYEAATFQSLPQHPNIVTLHGLVREEGLFLIVMELVRGVSP